MRHGGGEFSHAAQPCEPRKRFLMQAQYRLGTAALCHKRSGKKSRQGENQHERLNFRHFTDFVRESDPRKQLEIAEKVQARIISEGVTIPLGQYVQPMARRKNVSGNVASPVTVFWNVEKK